MHRGYVIFRSVDRRFRLYRTFFLNVVCTGGRIFSLSVRRLRCFICLDFDAGSSLTFNLERRRLFFDDALEDIVSLRVGIRYFVSKQYVLLIPLIEKSENKFEKNMFVVKSIS